MRLSLANFPVHLRRLLTIAYRQFLLIVAFLSISAFIIPDFSASAYAAGIHDSYGLTASTHFYMVANKSVSSKDSKNFATKHTVRKLLLAHASMAQLVARIEDNADNHLSPAGTQVFNAINAVREQFGLAPGLPTTAGRGLVIQGARTGNDPNMIKVGNGIPEEYSIWGAVSGVAAPSTEATSAVVNAWVYKDGWMGAATENLDCTSPTAPDCNGHRRAVLSTPPMPGAKLYINAVSIKSDVNGTPAVSIAALMIWVAP